jgi:LacI family transcriptional regulator
VPFQNIELFRGSLRLAFRITGSKNDIQDIYQEVFLKIYKKLDSFRFECSFSTWIYRIAAENLLRRDRSFTALVAFNDISALGAMTALREAGRNVPQDVSVVGFDDIEFASIAYPALATIRQPLQEMSATAGELLLRKLANDESVQNIRIRPEPIVRSSTCPPSLATAKRQEAHVQGPSLGEGP